MIERLAFTSLGRFGDPFVGMAAVLAILYALALFGVLSRWFGPSAVVEVQGSCIGIVFA